MKVIKLDLTGCKRLYEVHERIRVAFDFPDWYGKNWDAFWDLLWSDCDADKLIIIGENTLPKDLEEHLAIMHRILNKNIDFRNEYNLNPFSYKIINYEEEKIKIIKLDLTGCKFLSEIHERIRVDFDFPDWHGKNWDEFSDFLQSQCDADKLIIIGENTLSKDFEENLAIMHRILDRNIDFRNECDLNPFSYKIVS